MVRLLHIDAPSTTRKRAPACNSGDSVQGQVPDQTLSFAHPHNDSEALKQDTCRECVGPRGWEEVQGAQQSVHEGNHARGGVVGCAVQLVGVEARREAAVGKAAEGPDEEDDDDGRLREEADAVKMGCHADADDENGLR